jgi:hypothetical protein
MEQKNSRVTGSAASQPCHCQNALSQPEISRGGAISSGSHEGHGDDLGKIEEIFDALEDCWDCDESEFNRLPQSAQQALIGLDDLHRLAGATTVFLLDVDDYGYTTPSITCEAISVLAPELYSASGKDRVLAVCEEVQYSALTEQSALFQVLFEDFNRQYFGERLPDYKIRVVYDAWYWQTQRCGLPVGSPPLPDILGFIDFEGRQIFVRFHFSLPCGVTMVNTLIHEMAHAATDGNHGDNWHAEMARLKALGAPASDL